MPKDEMNRKRRKPVEPPCASEEDLQELMNGITESPESCAQMKKNIQKEIEFLRNHPELSYAKRDIEGLERFLYLASFAEHIFEISRNVNMKNLFEYLKSIKTHGPLDDKPKWEDKYKIEFVVDINGLSRRVVGS